MATNGSGTSGSLVCKACGAQVQILLGDGFKNQDIRCQYCGAIIESLAVQTFLEKPTSSKMRFDLPPGTDIGAILAELHTVLQGKPFDPANEEMRQNLTASGFSVHDNGEGEWVVRRTAPLLLTQRINNGNVQPNDVLWIAANRARRTSGPIPEENRIRCPECGAAASVEETYCQWCSTALK